MLAALDEITEFSDVKEKVKLMKIQKEIEDRMINVKRDTFHIGRLLCKGREIVGHGYFQKWVETAFGNELPYSTANLYMNVYRAFKDHESKIGKLSLSFLYKMSQARNPKEVKKMIGEKADELSKDDTDEIQDAFDLFKKGVLVRSDYVKNIDDIIKRGVDRETKRTTQRNTIPGRRSLYWGGSDILKQIRAMTKRAREMAHLYPYTDEDPEHKKFMKEIKKTIQELLKLRKAINNKDQFFDPHYEGGELKYDRSKPKNNEEKTGR